MNAIDLAKRLSEIRRQATALLEELDLTKHPRAYGQIAVAAHRLLDAELGCAGAWPRQRGVVAIWADDAASVARDVRDLLDDEARLLADMTQLLQGLTSDQLAELSCEAERRGYFDAADAAKKGAA